MSLLSLFGRLLVSMAVVLALMAIAAKVMRRRGVGVGPGRPGRRATIEIVARHGLSRNASIAVVRAGGKALVLGVTDTAVRVLAEADAAALEQPPDDDRTSHPGDGAAAPLRTWKDLIESVRERTVRRS
ncbi:MAG TPA: flagellar biosynthetic protein FliO [Acidimicrobiales bacterium]|nr:flagellar biosynthetic protein FliO [Acidimicrobiales bacterium]